MKTATLVINEVEYTVQEPTVGILFPIMDLMETDPKQFQMELVKRSIHVNGAPIGDNVNNLGLSSYVQLMQKVLELAGLGGGVEPVKS